MSISCFNLTGVCWTVYGLTFTTCSTVHIHSFHKKYIFVYTAFTLSYNRAVTGTPGFFIFFFLFATKESFHAALQCAVYSVPVSARSSCSLELPRLGHLAISLSSLLLLSCLLVWFVGARVCAASASLSGGKQQTRSGPLQSSSQPL